MKTTKRLPEAGTIPLGRTVTAASSPTSSHSYYRGRDLEYAWYVDRDRDGIDCER